MFEAAVSMSPFKSVDIVIGNAGVGRGSGDPMMALEGEAPSSWSENTETAWVESSASPSPNQRLEQIPSLYQQNPACILSIST